MPASVYSVRVLAVELTGAGAAVTVPAGKVWILHSIDAVNVAGQVNGLTVYSASGVELWNVPLTISGAGVWAQWRGRQVFAAGSPIGFNPVEAGVCVTASAYQLTPPS